MQAELVPFGAMEGHTSVFQAALLPDGWRGGRTKLSQPSPSRADEGKGRPGRPRGTPQM